MGNLCPVSGGAAGGGWLRFLGRLPHSHLHEKEVCPQAFPARAVMVNHFCSIPAEILPVHQ